MVDTSKVNVLVAIRDDEQIVEEEQRKAIETMQKVSGLRKEAYNNLNADCTNAQALQALAVVNRKDRYVTSIFLRGLEKIQHNIRETYNILKNNSKESDEVKEKVESLARILDGYARLLTRRAKRCIEEGKFINNPTKEEYERLKAEGSKELAIIEEIASKKGELDNLDKYFRKEYLKTHKIDFTDDMAPGIIKMAAGGVLTTAAGAIGDGIQRGLNTPEQIIGEIFAISAVIALGAVMWMNQIDEYEIKSLKEMTNNAIMNG